MTNEGTDESCGSCVMFELHDVTLRDSTLCCVTFCIILSSGLRSSQ